MTLQDLQLNTEAEIVKVGGNGELRQHFLDMGVIPGASVKKIKLAPMGDPMEIQIHGYELTMRLADAAKIEVKLSDGSLSGKNNSSVEQSSDKESHPGLGEEGKFHSKGDGNPLPDDTLLTYALVGNQNAGKTTLFNQLKKSLIPC